MQNKTTYAIINYSESNQNLKDNQYCLASVWKILFARLFDLLIASMPMILISLLWKLQPGDLVLLIVRYLIVGVWMFVYFVVFCWLLKAQSLGKRLFKIQLISLKKHKITFKDLFLREAVFIFIPWLIGVVCSILLAWLLPSQFSEKNKIWISFSVLIYQIGLIIVLLWWVVILISVKFHKLHQASIDIKLKLVVVETKPAQKSSKNDLNQKLLRDDQHISLTQQPGNFDLEFIDQIKNQEKYEYQKSINLKRKKPIGQLKLDSKEPIKQIESEKKDEH
ncbi:RDD family protein [Mycoplasma putrefaciens]|uniref:RDD domain-containing protein n=1 Tax=Mycoplasma putrefaciens Mput9231 TaxID=1292033 RepID=M9WGH7_9MOLU|nr:RDD family protein [Mycoplasma putrefaciens]AGJ90545.1 Hypothetical protein, predicted transmembrane protein [Mycoplasma putrefaciens Mput9231]